MKKSTWQMMAVGALALISFKALSKYADNQKPGIPQIPGVTDFSFMDGLMGMDIPKIPGVTDFSFMDNLFQMPGQAVDFVTSNLPQWDNPAGSTEQRTGLTPDGARIQAELLEAFKTHAQTRADAERQLAQFQGNLDYMRAAQAHATRSGAPVGGGTYQTHSTAATTSGIQPFTSVYNVDYQAAGAPIGFVPAPTAGSIVANTIGQNSVAAWEANLRAKGMNEADVKSVAAWHASRGSTIQG